MQQRDSLYADHHPQLADFVFDARVAAVFPDMIQRSVPGYGTIINMIGALAGRQIQADSNNYDLGCSLGAAALAMAKGAVGRDCRIIGVDNAYPMLQRARELIASQEPDNRIDLVCADIRDVHIERASMVVLNFTLQFVPLADRLALLERIQQGMLPGGLLVLSEKIALPEPQMQHLFTEMHHAFKKAQGYSELEISQKRTALENVLLPEPVSTHVQRLETAGFQPVNTWFQCFNFVSLLALKP